MLFDSTLLDAATAPASLIFREGLQTVTESCSTILDRWPLSKSHDGSVSKWRPVTSEVLQGSVLRLELLNIFVRDMDRGIKCTLSEFEYDTELCGVIDMLEGRDYVQRDLGRLKW